MRRSFDAAFIEHWQILSSNGLHRKFYVQKETAALARFMDAGDLSSIEQAVDQGKEPDADALRRVLTSSKIGAVLFADLGVKLDYTVFIRSVEKRLDDLEHLDFQIKDVDGFKTMMRTTAAQLMKCGQKSFDRKVSFVPFMTQSLKLIMSSTSDEWVVRLSARLKTVAINCKLVPLFPWERYVLGDAGVLREQPTPLSVNLLRAGANAEVPARHPEQ